MMIYLPIAEMSIQADMIILLGFGVGMLSGIFGVGGGFLTTPFLIFMGIPPAIAVGTQANQLIAASVSGVMGHMARDNVDRKMAFMMMIGSAVGTLLGVLLFKLLQYIGQIDLIISILYVLVLGVIGSMMFVDGMKTYLKTLIRREMREDDPVRYPKWLQNLPYKMSFPRSKLYISALIPVAIGFLGGFLAAILGIGGGFILVPLMIYVLGMSPLLVAGTSLFQVVFTASLATLLHALANQTVDLVLALILIIGGVVGAQMGVRIARRIKGPYMRLILSVIVLAVCFKLAFDLVIEPADIYSLTERPVE